MATDKNVNEDSVHVDVGDPEDAMPGTTFAVNGGVREVVPDESLPSLPDRPADSASRDTWADYCVALGADQHFLDNDTTHVDDAIAGTTTEEPPYTKDELKDLADRLGG